MARGSANLKVIRSSAPTRTARGTGAAARTAGGAGAAARASRLASAAGAAGAARTPGSASQAASDDPTQRIAEAITTAIVERRLMPGTKLAEQQIADLFKVSRTIVRQALNRLSRDHLVNLEPARGAFVAQPSIDEAHQVFEVRRMVEGSLVKQLCATITDEQIAALREHLRQEAAAMVKSGVAGRTSRTRLLADFHVVLARALGNEVLAQLLADLLSRCSLIALMYQSAHSAEHSSAEHVEIVDALARRDARAAMRLMESHLGHVERDLQLNPRAGSNLAAVLAPNPAFDHSFEVSPR